MGHWTSDSEELQCVRSPCKPGQAPNASDATQCIECPEGRYSAGLQQCMPCGGNEEWREDIGECRRSGKQISIEEAVRIFRGQSVGLQLIELVVGALSVVSTLCLCYIWCSRPTHRGAHTELAGVLRESFIGQDNLPARQLTALDVPARWVKAAAAANQVASGWSQASPSSSSGLSSLQRTASTESGLSRRLAKHSDNAIHVMFTSEHVCELQPPGWMSRPLGSGSYGVVYRASWRSLNVAVKALKLPERQLKASAAAEAKLKQKVEDVLFDFVAEIEVCCDLNHPNLVRLLGYAEKPTLFIVQELCEGGSVDQQLYVEGWRPTAAEVIKAAHDIAQGMEYLHTAYNAPDNVHAQPIIHRDLKSANLLMVAPPLSGRQLQIKITDFGLSRDKGLDSENYSQTLMMTGCGSVLWMAPEILLGQPYNETVDVYSFSMCVLELISCKLPWSGLARGAEVPNQVTGGVRPNKQLGSTVDPRMRQLLSDCWDQTPSKRPDFTSIILRLEAMMGVDPSCTASRCSHELWLQMRAGGSSGNLQAISEGVSRPASPGVNASEPEPEPEHPQHGHGQEEEGSVPVSDGQRNGPGSAVFRLPQRRTLLSEIVQLGAPKRGASTISARGVLAALWFSLPAVALLGVLVSSHSGESAGSTGQLISVCLAYCFIPCFAPLPIIKVVLRLLRQVRNEDEASLLRRVSASSAVSETFRREYLAHAGFVGLLQFGFGVVNMVGQLLLMVELYRGAEYILFAVVLSSSVATVVTSLPLAFCILHEIAREMQRDFFTEVMESPHVPWVVLFSTSRIESLSILRLQLCSRYKPCASFPMKPMHFYFIQSIGAYHFFIKDIPHVLVAFARISANEVPTGPRDVAHCAEWSLAALCRLALSLPLYLSASLPLCLQHARALPLPLTRALRLSFCSVVERGTTCLCGLHGSR